MIKQTYNNKEINAYLLGALPEAEADYFDELSFTDDEFADALKSAEKDLVDAYVNGELKGSELEKFQTHYLASPVRRKKVDFAKSFQVFAGKSAAPELNTVQAEIPAVLERGESPKGFFSIFNIFNNSRPVLQWGFAFASVALLIFGGWLFIKNSQLQNQVNEAQIHRQEIQQREAELQSRAKELQDEIDNQRTTASGKEEELAKVREELAQLEKMREADRKKLTEQEQKRVNELPNGPQKQSQSPIAPIIATFVLTPGLRGTSQIKTVPIPAQTKFADAQLELEPNDFVAFRVVLQNQADSRVLWQSGVLKAVTKGENKMLYVRLPAGLLKSNVYSLVVSGIKTSGETETIGNYPFQVKTK